MKRLLASVLRAILNELGDEDPKHVVEKLDTIKDNHLAHLQADVTSIQEHMLALSARVGNIEGRLGLLLGLLGLIFASLIAPYVISQFTG